MTITVRHREKKPTQLSVLSLKKGATFTGKIRYNYKGTPHMDEGLFLVTTKNARPADQKLVLMVLDSDLRCPQPYVIDSGFSGIQIEDFKAVDVAMSITEK